MNHGTLRLDRNESGARVWLVQCEPHVAMRLKRVFAKLGRFARDVHCLSDTIDNARDLLWFLDRFPLEVQPAHARYLQRRAKEHRDQQSLVERMLSGGGIERVAFELAVPAREYQREAASLYLATGSLLLADEVGLGKTISAICALTDPRTRPALVVTMTHLPFGWHRAVFDVWKDRLENLGVAFYTGTENARQKDEARSRFMSGDARVLVMSLRSGAGLDGLQRVCKTVAFGELDWSPKVMEQCTGRVHRDGQDAPVFAYYLTADVGADPIMLDVLDVKENQSQGILAPQAAEVEPLASDDGQHARRLAMAYLAQRGEHIEPEKAAS